MEETRKAVASNDTNMKKELADNNLSRPYTRRTMTA